MTDQPTEEAVNKLLGKKLYHVYARETVYSRKDVWAMDADEAETLANNEGFSTDEIIDGDNFEITDVEVDDEA
jgi:hypothetical protein